MTARSNEPPFQPYLDALVAQAHDVGAPGILPSTADVEMIEALFDAGLPLEIAQRALSRAIRDCLSRGRDFRSLTQARRHLVGEAKIWKHACKREAG